jgi:hypothetical protein
LLHADHGYQSIPGLPCALHFTRVIDRHNSDASGAARLQVCRDDASGRCLTNQCPVAFGSNLRDNL